MYICTLRDTFAKIVVEKKVMYPATFCPLCCTFFFIHLYSLFTSVDPPPFKDGVRINSPHYLCKMVEKGDVYTLVVSQYKKSNTIHFTLRVYATCEFSLSKIREPYKQEYEKQVRFDKKEWVLMTCRWGFMRNTWDMMTSRWYLMRNI